MKFDALDIRLIAARPLSYKSDAAFTDKVMSNLNRPEILSDSLRNMNVTKKETFMAKIKRLPALAIVAIILGIALVLSGSAYAVYQLLWAKPEVHVSAPTTSVSGRQEVAISFAQCGDPNALATKYELKKKATITIDDVPHVVQAHCELDAIGSWAASTYGSSMGEGTTAANQAYDRIMVAPSMATTIKSKDDATITFVGLTKYNQTDTTLSFTKDTRVIVDGHDAKLSDISLTDPVVYITKDVSHMTPGPNCTEQSCSMSGKQVSNELVAVVKLSQPLKYYDQLAWQSLAERNNCYGNDADSCISGFVAAVDLYEANIVPDNTKTQMKEIQGVITSINGPTIVIKSSSGTLFTIQAPSDIVADYNAHKAAQYYNGQTVQVGRSLQVRYIEAINEHSKTLVPASLMSVQMQMEIVGKSDPVTAY